MALRANDNNNVMTTYCVQGYAVVIQWWYSDTYYTHNIKHLLHSIQVIHSVLAMPTISHCLELNISDTSANTTYWVMRVPVAVSTRCSIYGTVRTKLPLERQDWSFQVGPLLDLHEFWKCLDVYDIFLLAFFVGWLVKAGTDPVAVIVEKALVVSDVHLGLRTLCVQYNWLWRWYMLWYLHILPESPKTI